MSTSRAAVMVVQSLYYPALFVLPLHAWRSGLPRNHPRTIWQRMATTLAATAAGAWLPTYARLADALGRAPAASNVLAAMGLRLTGLGSACVLPLLLTATLFAGPLAMLALDAAASQSAHKRQSVSSTTTTTTTTSSSSSSLVGSLLKQLRQHPLALRDYIAAPLTEELCFRAGLLSALLLGGAPPAACLWLSPLAFGVAHLHHWHNMVAHQGYKPAHATAAVVFQCCYTTVFGWYAAFLLLRTGNLAAPVVSHAFCNAIGFPRFAAIAQYPRRWQRLAAAAALASGIAGFAALLRPLTEPRLYGWPAGNSWAGLLRGLGSSLQL